MTIYEPAYEDIVIETVTTANKNIQSYFMRNDKSYYVATEDSFPLCNTKYPFMRLIVDNGCVILEVSGREALKSEIDCFTNNDYDTEQYPLQVCLDKLYQVIYSSSNTIINDLRKSSNEETYASIKLSEMFVQFIFSDFFGRSTIFPIIDILINRIGFKGIMLLPLSLAMSFALSNPSCSFVFEDGFVFIDEFVRADAYVPTRPTPRIDVDDQDFVEEFTRLQLLDESLRYSCEDCEHKEETEERIKHHISREHGTCNYFFYSSGGKTFEEEFLSRSKYLFAKEKAERMKSNVYAVLRDFDGAERIDNPYELAIKGSTLFSKIESAKETWMTQKEWREWRMRLLKEKVLFYI